MPTIGEHIRNHRKRNRVSQQDFAKALGVTQAAISQIESGKRNPSFEVLKALRDYGLSLDQLFDRL